jgi:hypothetical protein
MTEVQGATGGAGVHYLPTGSRSSGPPSSGPGSGRMPVDLQAGGALASAGTAVGQFLARSGFLDFRAPIQATFQMLLSYRPPYAGLEDLSSGATRTWLLFVRNTVVRDAQRSMLAQAHVRPEAAVELLR